MKRWWKRSPSLPVWPSRTTRLHRNLQTTAILEERNRMARDLHDTVIQHLYAVGLTLQSIVATSGRRPVRRPSSGR